MFRTTLLLGILFSASFASATTNAASSPSLSSLQSALKSATYEEKKAERLLKRAQAYGNGRTAEHKQAVFKARAAKWEAAVKSLSSEVAAAAASVRPFLFFHLLSEESLCLTHILSTSIGCLQDLRRRFCFCQACHNKRRRSFCPHPLLLFYLDALHHRRPSRHFRHFRLYSHQRQVQCHVRRCYFIYLKSLDEERTLLQRSVAFFLFRRRRLGV
jgi:hypothetical protein